MNDPSASPKSQEAFLRLLLASEREMLRYVMALVPSMPDAQEIVAETAVILWEKFDQYDASRPFTPWACRFALNVSKQWMARRTRWNRLLQNGLAEELAARREELRPVLDERLGHLESCLHKLPEAHRNMVDTYYFRQLGIDAVAEQAKRSVEASYKMLQRIRRQLRDCVERSLEEATT